jgi:predicted nucleic acid-binding protein
MTFLDTNILVRSTVEGLPLHAEARAAIESLEQAREGICISRQVLREYLSVLSRPQAFCQPLPAAELARRIREFEARFRILEDGPEVTVRLLDLVETIPVGGRQIHDANLVATMLGYGVAKLLTHNIDDFARFGHLVEVVPLVPSTL